MFIFTLLTLNLSVSFTQKTDMVSISDDVSANLNSFLIINYLKVCSWNISKSEMTSSFVILTFTVSNKFYLANNELTNIITKNNKYQTLLSVCEDILY